MYVEWEGAMSERNASDVVLAFIIGGLVGAAVGILYAPGAGKETRKKLKDMADDLTDTVEDIGGDVKHKAQQILSESKEKLRAEKDRIEDAIEAGKSAYQKKV
jgi:gas vesicle protein